MAPRGYDISRGIARVSAKCAPTNVPQSRIPKSAQNLVPATTSPKETRPPPGVAFAKNPGPQILPSGSVVSGARPAKNPSTAHRRGRKSTKNPTKSWKTHRKSTQVAENLPTPRQPKMDPRSGKCRRDLTPGGAIAYGIFLGVDPDLPKTIPGPGGVQKLP